MQQMFKLKTAFPIEAFKRLENMRFKLMHGVPQDPSYQVE